MLSKPVLTLVLLALPVAARAQSSDEEEKRAVLQVVQSMLGAMRTKDTVTLRSVFHPSARLFGMRPTAAGGTRVQELTAQAFTDFIARDQRPVWTERVWNPEVRLAGTLATVWAEYDFHFGTTFSHCGVDAFQLLKTADGWRIFSISDTYQSTNCSQRPSP